MRQIVPPDERTAFDRACALLFGATYINIASDIFEVAPRTISRWKSGKVPVPPGIYAELIVMMRERSEDLAEIVREIETQEIERGSDVGGSPEMRTSDVGR